MVRVKVIDVNDVTPEFSSRTYVVKVREDVPFGTVIGMVHASDPDQYQVLSYLCILCRFCTH